MVRVSNTGDTPASNVLSTLHVNPHFVDHERSGWKLFKGISVSVPLKLGHRLQPFRVQGAWCMDDTVNPLKASQCLYP